MNFTSKIQIYDFIYIVNVKIKENFKNFRYAQFNIGTVVSIMFQMSGDKFSSYYSYILLVNYVKARGNNGYQASKKLSTFYCLETRISSLVSGKFFL